MGASTFMTSGSVPRTHLRTTLCAAAWENVFADNLHTDFAAEVFNDGIQLFNYIELFHLGGKGTDQLFRQGIDHAEL